mgnify:CR=1 FL=1
MPGGGGSGDHGARITCRGDLGRRDAIYVKSQFANGTRMYCRYCPATTRHFLIRPDWTRGLVPMSYAAPIETE